LHGAAVELVHAGSQNQIVNTKKPPNLFACVLAPAPRYLLRLWILAGLFHRHLKGASHSFLEIGPGNGDVSVYLAGHPAISGGMVIDRSAKSVEMLRARLRDKPAVAIACADVRELGIESFDYVCSFEVLEHIEDDLGFMREVRRRMKPGAYWFISVPAYMSKWQRQDEFSGHVRRYEAAELRGKLAEAGLEVLELIDYGFPLTTLMHPFRERFYQEDDTRSNLEKTLASGTEKRLFGAMNTRLLLLLLLPFILLQYLFGWLRQGDGFIVVARRHE